MELYKKSKLVNLSDIFSPPKQKKKKLKKIGIKFSFQDPESVNDVVAENKFSHPITGKAKLESINRSLENSSFCGLKSNSTLPVINQSFIFNNATERDCDNQEMTQLEQSHVKKVHPNALGKLSLQSSKVSLCKRVQNTHRRSRVNRSFNKSLFDSSKIEKYKLYQIIEECKEANSTFSQDYKQFEENRKRIQDYSNRAFYYNKQDLRYLEQEARQFIHEFRTGVNHVIFS